MATSSEEDAGPVTFWCSLCQAWVDAPHECPGHEEAPESAVAGGYERRWSAGGVR